MNIRPEQRCEAIVSRRTVREPINRFVTDSYGRDHDRGANIREQNGIKQASVACERCSIAETLQAEGEGPFGHVNALERKIRESLADKCQKFQAFKPTPRGDWRDPGDLERASEEYFREI